MFCDATGKPDENGDFQLIDGKVCLRDGRRVSFDLMFRDAASTAKTGEPTSIDEALAQAFKQSAEAAGFKGDVSGWLAKLEPKELDKYVAQVATAFVRGHAGAGVGKHFASDAPIEQSLTSDEVSFALARAKAKHDMGQAWKEPDVRLPFTGAMQHDAIAEAARKKTAAVHNAKVFDAQQPNNSSPEIDRLRSEAAGARAARKLELSNAWRR